MQLRKLKSVGFTAATPAALATLINNFTAGQASGGYAAGLVGEKVLVDQQFTSTSSTEHHALLFFIE